MSRRTLIGAAVAVVAVIGAYALYDALVTTDEERLEVFVEQVTGSVTMPRVDGARRRWVDLERQPLEISALGESLLYRAGEDDALETRSHQALRTLAGSELRLLGSGIEVDGDTATVSLRVISPGQGLGTIEWTLRKHDEDWLVERLVVRR